MIIKNEDNLLSYVEKVEKNVDKLYSAIASDNPIKSEADNIRISIIKQLAFIRASIDAGRLLSQAQMAQTTSKIDELCQELQNKINQKANCSHLYKGTRQM